MVCSQDVSCNALARLYWLHQGEPLQSDNTKFCCMLQDLVQPICEQRTCRSAIWKCNHGNGNGYYFLPAPLLSCGRVHRSSGAVSDNEEHHLLDHYGWIPHLRDRNWSFCHQRHQVVHGASKHSCLRGLEHCSLQLLLLWVPVWYGGSIWRKVVYNFCYYILHSLEDVLGVNLRAHTHSKQLGNMHAGVYFSVDLS